jgi:myo-inositol-1(or 4)-monophosphatase
MNRVLLATCVAAAARAAEIIRAGADRRSTLSWETKSPGDFLTEVDLAAEQAIMQVVRERHPDARLLAEETASDTAARDGILFVADPLDGTTNFLHGFPWYAVSIAALVDGETRAGVVLNAANGELFTATLGGGARKNGQAIAVSRIGEPIRSLIATGFPFKEGSPIDEYLVMLPRIMRETSGLRRPGAAALDLADVACGRFEAFWELLLAPWDIAAGTLLIREAGGVVTNLAGSPAQVAHTGIIAGNPVMHAWLRSVVGARE